MVSEFERGLDSVDQTVLTPLVCTALNNDKVKVSDWSYTPLHKGGGGTAGAMGVYRFSGNAHDQSTQEEFAWSMILKAFDGTFGICSRHETDWNYWKREILFYESGLSEDLPRFLTAPCCFGVTEYSDEEYWVWLEDLGEQIDQAWSLEDYGLVARYLGQFNGAYLMGKSIPAVSWLSKGRVRDWLHWATPVIENLDKQSEEPIVRRWLGSGRLERVQQLWSERERLLAGLDSLPRCLCHHDAFCRNLMVVRQGEDNKEGLVGIDWAMVGTGAIGEEIAPLVGVSLQFLEVGMKDARELDQLVFEGYLTGLGDSGWAGDPDLVRFGFTATTAIFVGLGSLASIGWLKENPMEAEEVFRQPFEEIVDRLAAVQSFLLDLGDEARELVEVLE